jgi:hypothetical protein
MMIPAREIMDLGHTALRGSGFDDPLPAGIVDEGKRPFAMLIGSWPAQSYSGGPSGGWLRLELLQFLLEAGADINAEIKPNQTALTLAVASCKTHAVAWLLIRHARVTPEDRRLASQLTRG